MSNRISSTALIPGHHHHHHTESHHHQQQQYLLPQRYHSQFQSVQDLKHAPQHQRRGSAGSARMVAPQDQQQQAQDVFAPGAANGQQQKRSVSHGNSSSNSTGGLSGSNTGLGSMMGGAYTAQPKAFSGAHHPQVTHGLAYSQLPLHPAAAPRLAGIPPSAGSQSVQQRQHSGEFWLFCA